MLLEELGNVIKTYRNRLGFTQNDLAAALQVSPQAVSKWERGENAPDIGLLPGLSETLGVSIDTLLGSNYREKRVIEATVLFADMEGYGPIARKLAPADQAIALNAFFYPLTEHLIAFDGVPIKYIGDEVLCLFAGENHRLRGFRAAFAAKRDSPRKMRLSLATGAVWMGPLGHPLYARPDILGVTVNIASALQEWMRGKAEGGVAATASAAEPAAGALELGYTEETATWCADAPVKWYEVRGLA
jgi:transcriptional regulator with XRE-family HTH domain